jgi:hypothetical protein
MTKLRVYLCSAFNILGIRTKEHSGYYYKKNATETGSVALLTQYIGACVAYKS